MAASKFFVTVCATLSWAWMWPAIEKARAAQMAAMMVRTFMRFLPLPCGRSSFFIVSSPALPAFRTPYGVYLAGVKSTRAPVDNEHRERGENARDRAESHHHVEF